MNPRSYKASAIQWIGAVPREWEVAPLYSRYEVTLGKMLDSKRVSGQHLAPYLRNVDVQWDKVNIEGLPEMDFGPGDRLRYELRKGDLLVCEGGEVGRTAMWSGELEECYYQKAIHRLRPLCSNQVPRFFYYVLRAAADQGVFIAGSNPNTIDHLTAVQLRHHRFPFPPGAEQRSIATFLDRETAKIDALIDRKQRLIELLQEKRTALITQAVTQGLDPEVEMKDSGVEWLGEIPAHWDVTALKHALHEIEQGWSPECESRQATDEEFAVLKVGCVNGWHFEPAEHKALPSDTEPRPEYEVREGDLLISRANTRELLGSMARVGPVRKRMLFSDKLYRVVVDEHKLDGEFLVRFISSRAGRFEFERDATGASGSMQNISQAAVRKLQVPRPPLMEQRAICCDLAKAQKQIELLERGVRKAVEKLREYRTALIAAAVTGKIDVREAA